MKSTATASIDRPVNSVHSSPPKLSAINVSDRELIPNRFGQPITRHFGLNAGIDIDTSPNLNGVRPGALRHSSLSRLAFSPGGATASRVPPLPRGYIGASGPISLGVLARPAIVFWTSNRTKWLGTSGVGAGIRTAGRSERRFSRGIA